MGNVPYGDFLAQCAPLVASGAIRRVSESDLVARIRSRLPFSGSKIAWSKMRNVLSKRVPGGDLVQQGIRDFVGEALGFLPVNAGLMVVGDSAMTEALIMTKETLMDVAGHLFDLPQHTYIVNPEVDWCLVFSMEGWMDFGFLPE